MKNKFLKRIVTLLIVTTILSFTFVGISFATDTSVVSQALAEDSYTIMEFPNLPSSGITPLANNIAQGVVAPGQTINLYLHLDSYIGLSKNFIVNTVSDSTTGALFLYLYDSKGKLVSDDWIMGLNHLYKWSVFLPSSGDYRLEVIAGLTNAPVQIRARWE